MTSTNMYSRGAFVIYMLSITNAIIKFNIQFFSNFCTSFVILTSNRQRRVSCMRQDMLTLSGALIDREPEGVSLAEKLTNFLLYSEHLCI